MTTFDPHIVLKANNLMLQFFKLLAIFLYINDSGNSIIKDMGEGIRGVLGLSKDTEMNSQLILVYIRVQLLVFLFSLVQWMNSLEGSKMRCHGECYS